MILCFSIICMISSVYADDINSDYDQEQEILEEIEIIQTVAEVEKVPNINSRAAVVIERKSGNILFGKQENEKRPMASTTKIMTAIVVLEKANLSDTIEVSKKAGGTGGSRLGLKAGDKITVHDLLYGLMLCSGNDAAVALAEHVGGSIEGFAELMNQKAKELRLENTNFVTPHGLDEEQHYTTALELAKITNYALENAKFSSIVGTKNYTVTINGNSKNLNNTNELLGNLNGVYGVKTGFTNGANRCLVTSIKRGELDIICVVLGADTKKFRTQDSVKLIEYTCSNYEVLDLKQKIEDSEEWKQIKKQGILVEKGDKEKALLELEEMKVAKQAIEKNKQKDLRVEVNVLQKIEAPVEENKIVGSVQIKIGDEVVESVNIIIKERVEKKQILDYLRQFMKEYIEIGVNVR